MQHLNAGMLNRYDIPEHRPAAVRAVQFGTGGAMLGVVDRLLDAAAPGFGLALVAGGRTADQLREQDGMFTVLVCGYDGETPVRREQVVQNIIQIVTPDGDFADLAALSSLQLCLFDADAADPGALLRFLKARFDAGLSGLPVVCVGDEADAFDPFVNAAGDVRFAAWLNASCPVRAALAEGFAFRADARSAARVCAEMNYADAQLHLAEPFARLSVEGAGLLPEGGGIITAPDIARAFALKRRAFDAALFSVAAPGWLLGCDALSDGMKREDLRAFAGNAVLNELMPTLPFERAAASTAIIEAFGRFENPLTENRLLPSSRPLLRRFERGALPAIRAYAEEHFDAPPGLTHALAATIMLYAGARPAEGGGYEVLRGDAREPLDDNPDRLQIFAALSHDMPPESLAYAVLSDRELWGEDLREIDGLEARLTLALAAIQRNPTWLPEANEHHLR